jgi:hypothetical protein
MMQRLAPTRCNKTDFCFTEFSSVDTPARMKTPFRAPLLATLFLAFHTAFAVSTASAFFNQAGEMNEEYLDWMRSAQFDGHESEKILLPVLFRTSEDGGILDMTPLRPELFSHDLSSEEDCDDEGLCPEYPFSGSHFFPAMLAILSAGIDRSVGPFIRLGYIFSIFDESDYANSFLFEGCFDQHWCGASGILLSVQAGLFGFSLETGYAHVSRLGSGERAAGILLLPIFGVAGKVKALRTWGNEDFRFRSLDPEQWYLGPEAQIARFGVHVSTGYLFQISGDEEQPSSMWNFGIGIGF